MLCFRDHRDEAVRGKRGKMFTFTRHRPMMDKLLNTELGGGGTKSVQQFKRSPNCIFIEIFRSFSR